MWGGLRRAMGCIMALAGTAGCDATLQGFGAYKASAADSLHAGPMFEGRIHIPRSYEWVAGVEAGHLLQPNPPTVVDQWRFGIVGGRNALAQSLGSRIGSEWTARVGLFRGSYGSAPPVRAGLYGGFSLGMPIRISATKEPWQMDDLLLTTWTIVPQIGFNALMPEIRPMDTAIELSAAVGVRVNLSSSLLP